MPATFRKILADLWDNKARSILAALSIAVGVFAVGVIISTMILVKRDMDADYFSSNPHTARLYTQPFDDSLLGKLRSLPEVQDIDASYHVWLKIEAANGKLYLIDMYSIDSLESIRVDKLDFESGSPTLANDEIYIERQGISGMGLPIGEMVNITLENGQTRQLRLAGAVHDVNGNPFNFSSSTSGFVTHATMQSLSGSALNNFVNLVTAGSHTDSSHVRQMADRVAEVAAANGIQVLNVSVNRPGEHPAQSIIDAVMALLGALSGLVVFLSIFLITNTISALLGQQIRQIGVMKALGATFFQVIGVYLGLVLAFGVIGLVIALPLSTLAAYGATRWLVGMLNANPSMFSLPVAALLAQLIIGLLVPVMAALIPVIGGARRTVRQAITSYGLEGSAKPGLLDRLSEALPFLPRPTLLSLRNTFRRKSRLALTLLTLTLGGGIFIAVMGVRESMYVEIDQTASYYKSDVNVLFARNYPHADLAAAVDGLPGVSAFESWTQFNANVVRPDGETTDLVAVYVPPDDTRLLSPVLIEGRWLQPGEKNTIVVSNYFHTIRPEVGVGDTIHLRWNDQDTALQVVGIFRMSGNFPAPFTYITPATLAAMGGDPSQANQLRLVTDLHTLERQDEVLKAAQGKFDELGLEATLQTGAEFIAQQRSTIKILVTLLMIMGFLIAVVGGLGLMGTMGMNVLERTREIGVLRSIGAENGEIFQIVLVEGILIGLISWVGSALLAIPITQLLDKVLGQSLMTIALVYIFSTRGLLIWLGIVLILSALSSLLPARNAVRLTVRDVLAYE